MRTAFYKKRFVFSCTLLVLSLLCCVNEYNPFNDNANARTYILRTSLNLKNDTIPVFTTDSLELLFTVCNLIQKVSIQVTNNRYFDFKMIDEVCANKIETVSFYDTGYQEVRIVTYRQNGDSVILKKRYYVKSCFELDSIRGYYGDTLHLYAKTNNNKLDKDIRYVWKIGSVQTPPSRYNDTIIIINDTTKNDYGQLFICDDKNKSPAFLFKATLLDNLPVIVIPDGVDSDTLYTNNDSIDLKVRVEKSITLVNTYVNGLKMENDIMPNTFVKRIKKTDSQIKKLTIDVVGRVGNQRVVYVEFNSKKQQSVIPRLKIMELMTNGEVIVMEKDHTIEGSVDFSSNQALQYTVSIFDGNKFIDSTKMVSNRSFTWSFPVALEKEKTIFRIEVSDQLNVVDDTALIINYCKNCIDSVPPEIASILVNGSIPISGNRYVINKRDAKIELIFYDAGDVDSVIMNNRLMKHDGGIISRWSIDTLINHITKPDTFFFYAIDNKGNRSAKDTIVAGYNTSPYVSTCPDSIEHTLAGTLYTSSIDIRDYDANDFITYSINKADVRGIFIDEKGTIKWTPEKSDAGFHHVEITGTDRGGSTILFSYVIYVSETALDTVKFVTSRDEFPVLLPCTDSINIPLIVRGGTKPFVFEITDRTRSDTTIPVNPSKPYFKWKPKCASDTGAHQFFIVVRDTLRLSDTLWPVVTVLPQNRDFEVKELRWSGSRKPDSTLDLSRNRTDTLHFAINDPDNPQYERHTINVTSGIEKYTITTDSGKFFISLSHLAKMSGRDSLVLTIRDKGNHVKNIIKKLDYGKPPLTPVLLKPQNDTIMESKDIQFRWSCSDPDGEQLKYHVTLQFIDGTFQVNKDVQDTFCIVTGLKKSGVYFWSVIARDSKSTVSSLTRKLTCLPPDRVRIDTTVSKLPQIISCKTSIKAPVVIRNGYPPFTFKCNPPVVVKGDSIVWIADCNKTGSYKINLMVEDSAGNTDSFIFNTSIYGSDSLDLRIVNDITRNNNKEIDLSGTQVKTVVCTLSIIDPDPSPPENFIVDVFLGNLQQQYFNNYVGRTFLVSLKPDTSKTLDTLSINVTDMNGNKKNLTEVIYYGH